MSFTRAVTAAAFIAASLSSAALAQTVGHVEADSDVVVKRSGEYFAAQNMSPLAADDCVIAFEAPVVLRLENGCEFDLAANQSVMVKANETTCDASFASAEAVCAMSDFESQDLQLGLLPLLIGAAAIIPVVVAVADDDEPSSP